MLVGKHINDAMRNEVPEGIFIHECEVKTTDGRNVAIASKEKGDILAKHLNESRSFLDGVPTQLMLE